MSRLIDCFPEWSTNGIFIRLGSIYPGVFPWVNERGWSLDQIYFGNHSGDKETSPLLDKFIEQNRGNAVPEVLTEQQLIAIVSILYAKYESKWSKLYKVLFAEYNPIENYSMTEEETPDITRTETPNITRGKTTSAKSDFTVTTNANTATDVYGFNSNSAVPQGDSNGNSTVKTQGDADKNVTTENETETGTRTERETGKRTLTRSGNIGVTTSQRMLESEIKLWEWNFYETVFKDVDTVLTVPKYNFY